MRRGQASKVVSNAAGYSDTFPPGQQTFADVTGTDAFWLYIERMYAHGTISGYPCGGLGEPCDLINRPYFRPNTIINRGQTAKIVANAANYIDQIPTSQESFADVPNTHTFWLWVERVVAHNVISGYPCGGLGEPCDPQNRPYFRWGNPVTRGQASKIVANAFYPNCQIR
jgi:hypothetical protein